ELDVGGNHFLKNLKALIGLGVILGEDRMVHSAVRRLCRQIDTQVLADGGHYERSPWYHAQVLGDLLDIEALLASARRPPVPGLGRAVAAMRAWLGAILMPDGDVPIFNDGSRVGINRLAILQPRLGPHRVLTVLQPSGYVVVRLNEL